MHIDPFTRKLSEVFTAVFGYEESEREDRRRVAIKERAIAVFHGTDEMNRFIDYALLELDVGDKVFECPELLCQYSSDPKPVITSCHHGHAFHHWKRESTGCCT